MKLTVEGVPGLDGAYQESIATFTNREWHVIKKETGLRAGEMQDAFEAGDTDAIVAIAATVLTRAGKEHVWPLLWEDDVTKLTFDFTDEEASEADAGPPEVVPPSDVEPVNGSGNTIGSSGETSPLSLALPASDQSHIGVPI